MDRETLTAYSLAAVGGAQGVFKYYIRPELSAARGWLAIGALVTAYELSCPEGELLSEGVDRGIDKHPIIVPLSIGVTALHLANVLPEKYDPFSIGMNLIKGGHRRPPVG